jgi:mannose-6-phosphate isomerase-like protein (cupin superfamily)
LLTGRIKPVAENDEYFTRGKFARPVNSSVVARDWIERGYSCRGYADPPGQEWRDFVYDTDELVTVMEGQLEITMGNQCWVLDPGDELYIPRGALHTVRNTHDKTTHWLYGYD